MNNTNNSDGDESKGQRKKLNTQVIASKTNVNLVIIERVR